MSGNISGHRIIRLENEPAKFLIEFAIIVGFSHKNPQFAADIIVFGKGATPTRMAGEVQKQG